MSLDKENELFDKITRMLDSEYETIYYGSTQPSGQPKFPFVFIEMSDQHESRMTRDSDGIEKYRDIKLTVEVYSSKSKQETKGIMEKINTLLRMNNFLNTATVPMRGGNRGELYRRVATFEAIASENNFYSL